MFSSLITEVSKKFDVRVKNVTYEVYFNEINKYNIKDITSLILEYLNFEVYIWKYGFISRRVRIFDDFELEEENGLTTNFPIYFYSYKLLKYIDRKIDKRIHIDWLDNHEQLNIKDYRVTFNKELEMRSYCDEINQLIFEKFKEFLGSKIIYTENIQRDRLFYSNNIFKIFPTKLEVTIVTQSRFIKIKEPTYVVFLNLYKPDHIIGSYTLREYFVDPLILKSLKKQDIINKNPFLNLDI